MILDIQWLSEILNEDLRNAISKTILVTHCIINDANEICFINNKSQEHEIGNSLNLTNQIKINDLKSVIQSCSTKPISINNYFICFTIKILSVHKDIDMKKICENLTDIGLLKHIIKFKIATLKNIDYIVISNNDKDTSSISKGNFNANHYNDYSNEQNLNYALTSQNLNTHETESIMSGSTNKSYAHSNNGNLNSNVYINSTDSKKRIVTNEYHNINSIHDIKRNETVKELQITIKCDMSNTEISTIQTTNVSKNFMRRSAKSNQASNKTTYHPYNNSSALIKKRTSLSLNDNNFDSPPGKSILKYLSGIKLVKNRLNGYSKYIRNIPADLRVHLYHCVKHIVNNVVLKLGEDCKDMHVNVIPNDNLNYHELQIMNIDMQNVNLKLFYSILDNSSVFKCIKNILISDSTVKYIIQLNEISLVNPNRKRSFRDSHILPIENNIEVEMSKNHSDIKHTNKQ